MSMIVNPFVLGAGAPPPPGGDPSVYAVKHYVVVKLTDGAHIRALKHYIIAKPP